MAGHRGTGGPIVLHKCFTIIGERVASFDRSLEDRAVGVWGGAELPATLASPCHIYHKSSARIRALSGLPQILFDHTSNSTTFLR